MTLLSMLQEEATEMPEGLEALGGLIEAAQGGEWSLFVSLLIMVLVWLATKAPGLKKIIKGDARIWTAAVAGVLSAFAGAMYSDLAAGESVDWVKAIMQGLSVGFAAGGLWSAVGKKIAGKPLDADGDGVLDSE